MYGSNALAVSPRGEGVPISGVYYDRASSLIAGGEASMRAGVGGVAIGRAGWCAPNGVVLNARTTSEDLIGMVVIEMGDWRRVFWDSAARAWRIREGLNMTMLTGAQGLWVKLDSGGTYRARIYADPIDGRLVASYAVGLEATRWSVARPVGPGGLTLITTWNDPL